MCFKGFGVTACFSGVLPFNENNLVITLNFLKMTFAPGVYYSFTVIPAGGVPVTVNPMLLAVPATILMADSNSKALRSLILSCAIAATWSQVTVPTFLRFGSADPDLTFEASSN